MGALLRLWRLVLASQNQQRQQIKHTHVANGSTFDSLYASGPVVEIYSQDTVHIGGRDACGRDRKYKEWEVEKRRREDGRKGGRRCGRCEWSVCVCAFMLCVWCVVVCVRVCVFVFCLFVLRVELTWWCSRVPSENASGPCVVALRACQWHHEVS